MKPLTVGSLFAGIGGFDLGLERAGMRVKWSVENDKFCNKVRRRHWPDVPQYGDITTLDPTNLEPVDLICGGFPCQDVSVAGARKGLAGERSGLFFEATRIIGAATPKWVVIENVPGLFSSQNGRDFEIILGALAQLGYGVGWRVLDSQYFGIPQRRRRVFIVGHLGAPCPPEVLFESESFAGIGSAGAASGEEIAGALGTSLGHHGGAPTLDGHGAYVYGPHNFPDGREWHDLTLVRAVNTVGGSGGGTSGIVVEENQFSEETDAVGVRAATGVSGRVDPVGKHQPDGPRYRALGNAVSVPVAHWIGQRIVRYELCGARFRPARPWARQYEANRVLRLAHARLSG